MSSHVRTASQSRIIAMSPEEIRHTRRRRLVSLGGSLVVSLAAGTNYAFSSFAPQLQEACKLTSTQINIVGLGGNIGMYASGPFIGRWVDKRGPYSALFTGAVLMFIGYSGLSAAYAGSWHSAYLIALCNMVVGVGSSAGFTAAMNAQAKSWDGARRGTATAVVLSGFGLSAFLWSSLSHYFFAGNVLDYLHLLAVGGAASMFLGLALVRILPPVETAAEEATRRESSSEERPTRPEYQRRRRTSSEIGGRAWGHTGIDSPAEQGSDDENDLDGATAAGSSPSVERAGLLGGSSDTNKGSDAQVNLSGRKLLRTVDFFLLFAIMSLISGAGLCVINNIGSMTKTLYYYHHRPTHALVNAIKDTNDQAEVQQHAAHQVSAISIGNASGRLLIGFLSDLLVNRTGITKIRVWLLVPVAIIATLSQLLAALPNTVNDLDRLLIFSTMSGLSYGFLFGTAPVLTFEFWGAKGFSQSWGFVGLAPVVAGNVLNIVFGRIFDSHALPGSHLCLEGEECYRDVFKITTACTFVSILLSCVLAVRRAGWPSALGG